MVISDENIKKFQEIYRKYYGTEISKQNAYEQGMKLITLMKLIYKPMTQKEYLVVQRKRLKILQRLKEDL